MSARHNKQSRKHTSKQDLHEAYCRLIRDVLEVLFGRPGVSQTVNRRTAHGQHGLNGAAADMRGEESIVEIAQG